MINFECNFNFEIQMEKDAVLSEEDIKQWKADDIKVIDLLEGFIGKDPTALQWYVEEPIITSRVEFAEMKKLMLEWAVEFENHHKDAFY